MKKNYIFDLYGTLIDIHTDEDNIYLWKKLASIYEVYGAKYKPLELKKKYKEYCINEIDKLSSNNHIIEIVIDDVFYKLLIDRSDKKIDKEVSKYIASLFRILSRDYMRLYPGVLDTLNYLKKHNKNIYLLSNAQRSFTQSEIEVLGLDKYFDDIFISSDYGIKKPDKEYLNKLINKHHLKKEECLFIGNEYESDIKIAYLNNIDSVLFNTNKYSLIQRKKYEEEYKDYKVKVISSISKLKEID